MYTKNQNKAAIADSIVFMYVSVLWILQDQKSVFAHINLHDRIEIGIYVNALDISA